jgi:hypothetical protein
LITGGNSKIKINASVYGQWLQLWPKIRTLSILSRLNLPNYRTLYVPIFSRTKVKKENIHRYKQKIYIFGRQKKSRPSISSRNIIPHL